MTQITPSNPLKVVVKRSKWGRGNGCNNSRLFNPMTGLQCCLGFACLAAKYNLTEISNKGYPLEVSSVNFNNPFRATNELVFYDLARINDAFLFSWVTLNTRPAITISSEEQREKLLTELAAAIGIEFTFED